MKKLPSKFHFLSGVALLALIVGCATTKHTESLLSEAGFLHVPATTDKQAQHLMSLPKDKVTIARINGRAFYVFPDPTHKLLYVGNSEQFQTYQQLLTYSQLEGNSRVLAVEDDGPGDDTAKWVEWTNTSGWTHGTE
ncbi:MAG TPA: hypothetical protein VL863_12480 [bacterium]|nr:hypothetical protein [bacterium]